MTYKIRTKFAAVLFAFTGVLLSGAATAQTILGKSLIDGRSVVLFSDGTWEFETLSEGNACKALSKILQFCGEPTFWVPQPKPNPLVAGFYRHSATEYLMLVPEQVGSDNALTAEAFLASVIQNAASGAGVSTDDVVVSENYLAPFQEGVLPTIGYSVTIAGTPYSYLTSIYLGRKNSLQILTFIAGETEIIQEHRAFHEEALTLTTFDAEIQ